MRTRIFFFSAAEAVYNSCWRRENIFSLASPKQGSFSQAGPKLDFFGRAGIMQVSWGIIKYIFCLQTSKWAHLVLLAPRLAHLVLWAPRLAYLV